MAEEEHYITVTIGFDEAAEKILAQIQEIATEWDNILHICESQFKKGMLHPDNATATDVMTNSFSNLCAMLEFLEVHFRRLWMLTFAHIGYKGPKDRGALQFEEQFGYTKNIARTNQCLMSLLHFYETQPELQRLLQYSTHKRSTTNAGQEEHTQESLRLRLHATTT